MTKPRDQSARDRFAKTLNRNFSVVAAAGSGKTRAVTDRIAQLAQAPDALRALPRLVVLTFANRAADEMQQRAREQILRAKPGPEILAAFNRAWFGTIHAFCLKLLNDYGHYLGLPAPLELITDDDDLWNEFVQQQTSVGRSLSAENRAALLRLASMRHIMELGRHAGSALLRPGEPCPCPEIDLKEVYRAALAAKKSETVGNSIAQLKAWEEGYRGGTGFIRWPTCFTKAQGIDEIWARAFVPLRRWVNQTAICVAAEVQRDYRNFRLERGVVTYADQIALADELLQHPEAAHRIRHLDPIVILDEAQDTDPAQFSVLLEITRPPDATGRWLQNVVAGIGDPGCPGHGYAPEKPGSPTPATAMPPRPGSFCMVGDFQQSIYHDRADLAHCQRVHDALVQAEGGEAVTFSVTFRLDQKQLDFVNATFGEILNNGRGQVKFVELQPRPQVLPGQVIRLSLSAELLGGQEKLKDRQTARIEANELARWLKEYGPEKLRARNWREVAILCPRRDWLRTMAIALRKIGLPVEVQSESDLQADSPAYAWLTALCTIMVEPQNHYEIVGVLREVYGVSDHSLAVFSEGDGARFQIETPVAAAGVISSQIAELTELRVSIQTLPLFAAVEQLIERTALRARLASLPPEDFKNPLADLDTLLTLAAESGATGATLADFGDGGFTLIDRNATDVTNLTMYHTYFNSRTALLGTGRVLTTPCATEGEWAFRGAAVGALPNTPLRLSGTVCGGQEAFALNGINIADNVNFYAPMVLGPGNPNTWYYGSDKLYRSTDRADTAVAVSQLFDQQPPPSPGAPPPPTAISTIAVAQDDDNYRMVGLNNGEIFATTTGAPVLLQIAGPGATNGPANTPATANVTSGAVIGVGRIRFDPNNKNVAYVAYTGFGTPAAPIAHLYKVTNLNNLPAGNVTFTPISTGLADIPHNAIAIDPMSASGGASTDVYVGTDNGVYNTRDGGATWFPYGTGFPHVSVFGLEIQNPSRVLRAATHGRGMYETPVALQPNLPQILSVVSRLKHGPVEPPFDINLPVQGPPGIECRTGPNSGEYSMVFRFTKNIESVANAAVTQGNGMVNPTSTGTGPGLDEYTVGLTGVTDLQTIVVTLNGVQDSAGGIANNLQAVMSIIHGDTNGDGRVNVIDTNQAKSNSGNVANADNFRTDVNTDGRINVTDTNFVKAHAGSEARSRKR